MGGALETSARSPAAASLRSTRCTSSPDSGKDLLKRNRLHLPTLDGRHPTCELNALGFRDAYFGWTEAVPELLNQIETLIGA